MFYCFTYLFILKMLFMKTDKLHGMKVDGSGGKVSCYLIACSN